MYSPKIPERLIPVIWNKCRGPILRRASGPVV